MTLEKGLAAFLDAMLGKNRSAATLRAYKTDVLQFIRVSPREQCCYHRLWRCGEGGCPGIPGSACQKGLDGDCQSPEGLSDPGVLPLSGRGGGIENRQHRHRHPKAGEAYETVSSL